MPDEHDRQHYRYRGTAGRERGDNAPRHLAGRCGGHHAWVAGAGFFAAAGAWLLATAGDSPAYAAVVLPAMLLWGTANALIQPSLFACADAAPRAELAVASAVLGAARQLGSALGVATFVAVLGGRTDGLAGFDRAWIVVMITAAITAFGGLAAGRRSTPVPEVPAHAGIADDGPAIACGTSATRGSGIDRRGF